MMSVAIFAMMSQMPLLVRLSPPSPLTILTPQSHEVRPRKVERQEPSKSESPSAKTNELLLIRKWQEKRQDNIRRIAISFLVRVFFIMSCLFFL